MAKIDPSIPFVLLDDARAGKRTTPARLFSDPVAEVVAQCRDEVRSALKQLRDATEAGLYAAGWIGYEAGLALEERLAALPEAANAGGLPLLHFGLFQDVRHIHRDDIPGLLPDPAGVLISPPTPLYSEADYTEAFDRVKALIAAGDIYQANLSFPARVDLIGHPLGIYARLRAGAAAGWGGIVHLGGRWLLSASPEQFFTLERGRLTARPMKGTTPRRDDDPAADARAARWLAADQKERAENLMIVDLLRNDLSRIAAPGSVETPQLFEVESYPTVHQLTSTVSARIDHGRDAVDVIATLFPCGSITGAPKIRAMEILVGIEPEPRGPYTGSIGWLGPNGDAGFDVTIRTLVVDADCRGATLGLGSGVVADSTAGAEWRECLNKAAFVTKSARPFDLIETMRFDPWDGLLNLERHIARLSASAAALGFAINRHELRNELQAATFSLRSAARVRLLLSRSGAIAIETRPLPDAPEQPVAVTVRPLPVNGDDFRLRHKTSDRRFYDRAREESGRFEVLFTDADGYLTEGSFSNIFVERGGRLLTPPLSRGLLPGILRQCLIEEGRAVEADLRPAELVQGAYIGNALRGLIPVQVAPDERTRL